MGQKNRSWELATWRRTEGAPDRLPRRLRAELAAEVTDVPDDAQVILTAGMLRSLLAAHEEPQATHGASIYDPDRRVTYFATIHRAEGQAWLRTVEVVPHDERPHPDVFRVPASAVAAAAARVLAEQAAAGDPDDVVIWGDRVPPPGTPSAEELREFVRRGETRQTLAALFDKSVSRVDDWLREARRDRPDLDWPARTRGPRPKTPGGTTARATKERKRK